MDTREGKCSKIREHALILIVGVTGLVICITGIILLNSDTETKGDEIVKDYTDCTPVGDKSKCKDVLQRTGEPCTCFIPINITKPLEAPVTAFYELESYERITGLSFKSRDDQQLSGHLSLTPSDHCGAYTYVNTSDGQKKPIAPCGALADAMFNDTFNLQFNNSYIPRNSTGLISEDDKKPYKNPEGNLEQAFKPFSKPINWRNNVTMLDTIHPENNGFQNEPFIIWMKTDLKRKPAWRVDHSNVNFKNGLDVGAYTLRIVYAYPESRYNGRRMFIISNARPTVNQVRHDIGIALVVLGPLVIVAAIIILVLRIRKRY